MIPGLFCTGSQVFNCALLLTAKFLQDGKDGAPRLELYFPGQHHETVSGQTAADLWAYLQQHSDQALITDLRALSLKWRGYADEDAPPGIESEEARALAFRLCSTELAVLVARHQEQAPHHQKKDS